jgi:hypothetical protein
MDWTIFKEFGLPGLIVGGLFSLVFIMMKWQMSFIVETRSAHNEERRVWHSLDMSKAKLLDELVSSVKRHDEKAEERGRFVREEHLKFSDQQDKTCECLIEVKEGLLRVNGHTKI